MNHRKRFLSVELTRTATAQGGIKKKPKGKYSLCETIVITGEFRVSFTKKIASEL